MMSALECLAKAAKCEAMAATCSNDIDGKMLLEVADTWRNLAKLTKPSEPLVGPPYLPPPDAEAGEVEVHKRAA